MNILLSNDDAIDAKGIHVLADCLLALDDVNIYVCAPDRQRSCCGHALTMHDNIYIKERDPKEFNEKTLWAAECTGSPADCVRLALYLLRKKNIKIDLVCSGINMGANYGTDTYYSGTMAAAREGAICFTQSIAFSLCRHFPTHYEHFTELVPQVIKKTYGKLPIGTILNVNVPDIPAEEIKGIKICRMGPVDYTMDFFEKEDGGYCIPYDILVDTHTEMEYDSVAGHSGYITLTPNDVLVYNGDSEKAVESLGITF